MGSDDDLLAYMGFLTFCAALLAGAALLLSSGDASDRYERDPHDPHSWPYGSLERSSFDAAEALELTRAAESAYYIDHGRYTDDCRKLQSYEPDYAEMLNGGELHSNADDPRQLLCNLRSDGESFTTAIVFGDFNDNVPQRFVLTQSFTGIKSRRCDAVPQVGCDDGHWRRIGPPETAPGSER
jgi:hypothetical protein